MPSCACRVTGAAFTLSRELDTARIEAVLRDGVLSLRIPKRAMRSRGGSAVSAA